MAILIALILSFTSPSTLPIDLAESGCEICASSEQGGAAMCGQSISINVVRVLVTLHETLYLKRKVVVELCSSHLQRIIYGLDYDFEPLTIHNDGLYCLLYPKRH